MPFSTIVLGLLTGVSLIVTIYVIVSYRAQKEITREKFALRVFVMIISLASTLVTIILTGHTAIAGMVTAIERLFGVIPSAYEPGFSDKLLCVIILLSLIIFALRLHRNWHGDISIREHEATNAGVKPRVLPGALAAITAYHRRTRLEPYRPGSPRRGPLPVPPPLPPSEAKAWHSWLARSLSLIQPRLRIDEVGDWYPEANMLIGKYGLRDAPVGILCVHDVPTDAEITSAIEFATTEIELLTRLIVAVDTIGSRTETDKFSVPVELRFRSELLESLVDFDAYRADIKNRYELAEIAEGYTLTLQDLYVPPAGYRRIGNQHTHIANVEDQILSWALEHSVRHIALLGEYGEGKSVLALRITYSLLFNATPPKRIPILISLGGRSPRTQTKLSILAEWSAQYRINPLALLTLHEAGRLLLIFDAFDEMDLVGEPALRFDHFLALWEFSRDQEAKIMITGRPNFFLDQLERETALNIRSASEKLPYTDAIYLSRFTFSQISSALRAFSPEIRDEITAFLGSSAAPEVLSGSD